MNNVVLIGRITKNIELQKTQSGKSVVKFTLAVTRQKKEESDFISCIAWNKTAELMATYLTKGSLIGIEGRLLTGSYTNKEGRTVYTTDVVVNEVQFLEPKKKDDVQQVNKEEKYGYASSLTADAESLEIENDDLPF